MGRGYGYDMSYDRLGAIAGHRLAQEQAVVREKAAILAVLDAKAKADLVKKREAARKKAAERRGHEREKKARAKAKKDLEQASAKLQRVHNEELMAQRFKTEDEDSSMLPFIKEEEEDNMDFNFQDDNADSDVMAVDRTGIEAPPNSYVEESAFESAAFVNAMGSTIIRRNSAIATSGTTDDHASVNSSVGNSTLSTSATVSAYAYANISAGTNGFGGTGHRANGYYDNSAFDEAFYFNEGPGSKYANGREVAMGSYY
ncbi:uncharacterized protein EI97DRAFT_461442 [Westerdykella ornata]|uniref:Uncharacterized protein n=1 Tax=Westerdykella ornata TaxID=318751 RepID=A0A6A6JCT4_WESOR|nr:uncharacterized protein EI97DRAFT_461442 [Westerdykella ornata]KAF2272999.1 hypothetical protein EI97DRAFT_461442 [Westerdykella ornata]